MQRRKIELVNACTTSKAAVDALLVPLSHALTMQCGQFAWSWQEFAWSVDSMTDAAFKVLFVEDDAAAPGAAAYHDVATNGAPAATVLVGTILAHGGTPHSGSLSISAATSHEVMEALGDPGANRWASDGAGKTWALEACDATQGDSYVIAGMAMSNFLLPSYFDPFGKPPYDFLGLITAPFQIRPQGYAIEINSGQVLGDGIPEWRVDYTKRTGARTASRCSVMPKPS